ncbi:MAG: hypothetical protein KatS3mg131_0435 [Candidatus Tectimicrobiota bacterium]|nr:MAG: hypothetical protein KatS3mg131_0435 [Candidatus Tectomicrobia bacterium]
MRRVHDRGGWPDAGSIDRSEHDLAMWEKQTDALLRLLASRDKRILRVDELRRAIEDLDPAAYERMNYYERWLTAIENLLVEKGILTREAIAQRLAELAAQSG